MIVVSLLLILVAVALLVLGLAGGSSTLLISSIVASLLAAVSLVVGARQAAVTRRRATAPAGVPASPADDPFLADAPGVDEFAGEPPAYPSYAAAGPVGPDADDDGEPAAYPSYADAGPAGRDAGYDAGPAGSAATSEADAAAGPDPSHPASDPGLAADPASVSGGPDFDAGPAPVEDAGSSRRDAPDYDRASSVIGAARSANADESWRRDPKAEAPPVPGDTPGGFRGPDGVDATDGAGETDAEIMDEFAEPDADDPADEPLPQAVRPGDAVRVARMEAEVLVVDGRPRYHVADCPHLVGRLTEPLPANEAVELGFSPCGLCRPVDRLVAEAAHN